MELIAFVNNERLSLATNKLIYREDELESVINIVDQAHRLSEHYQLESEKIEEAEKNGYSDGYEKGQEAGYQAALEHIAVKLVVLSKEAAVARDKLEESAGNLAIKIVEKIAADIGPKKVIASMAKSAATGMVPKESVVLYVHPDNLEYMKREVLDTEAKTSCIVSVVSDTNLLDTDCVLETEFGRIKADLDTQLKVLAKKLYEN